MRCENLITESLRYTIGLVEQQSSLHQGDAWTKYQGQKRRYGIDGLIWQDMSAAAHNDEREYIRQLRFLYGLTPADLDELMRIADEARNGRVARDLVLTRLHELLEIALVSPSVRPGSTSTGEGGTDDA